MVYQEVVVKNSRIANIQRKHPWIFSGGIISHSDCEDGDLVEVSSQSGDFLAMGYFQHGSIMVRILSFEKEAIDQEFWDRKIQDAVNLRKDINLPNQSTNVYRLVHGEGDGLSGLVIDVYNNVAVIQCHSVGMHLLRQNIANALIANLEESIETIYVKSGNTLPRDYAANNPDEFLKGRAVEVEVKEYDSSFNIDIVNGQKTGFFIDQRENRKLLQQYIKDKSVLNLFSYTGGFSIYALNGGVGSVTSVDVSQRAMDTCDQNVALTGQGDLHTSLTVDVNEYLSEIESNKYDVIIVDPPAFAKSARKSHNAIQAYKRLNIAAIKKIKKGGLIFTFSCSQVIDTVLFYNTITAAAIEAGRTCQVLHRLSQGPDHPVSIFHPEGKYLKGLVLRIT
ncbi:MAG: 23S rRNA (cytosine1962-C5)-methyltransferase [Saprospiraceae bacterium]|jgi:23S rRNA (cytosine1962-C5)-methyltransferase